MSARLSSVIGAFAVIRKRLRAEGRPGMAIWADAGERSAKALGAVVRDGAHMVEIKALTLEEELRAMLADGVIDAGELGQLQATPGRLRVIAERAHDLSEVVS